MSNSKILRIIPIGGLGEVGKNMTLYEYGKDVIIVDAGLMFPENDMIGIDYIIPDFTDIIKSKKDRIRGIIITHGHEDHTGAIQHLLDEVQAPIYATPLTCGLVEGKLKRNSPGMAKQSCTVSMRAIRSKLAHSTSSSSMSAIPFLIPSGWGLKPPPWTDHPHLRLQIGSHTGGQLAHRLCQAGGFRQSWRFSAAFRFNKFNPTGLDQIRAGD